MEGEDGSDIFKGGRVIGAITRLEVTGRAGKEDTEKMFEPMGLRA